MPRRRRRADAGTAGEVYNIGGRAERENIEIVRRLCALVDELFAAEVALRERFPAAPAARGQLCETLIRFVTDRPGHDRRYAINCDKASRSLGFNPSIAPEHGLRATLRWYVDNEPWWRQVMSGEYRQWTRRQYGIE